jgi:hypothetical protein
MFARPGRGLRTMEHRALTAGNTGRRDRCSTPLLVASQQKLVDSSRMHVTLLLTTLLTTRISSAPALRTLIFQLSVQFRLRDLH